MNSITCIRIFQVMFLSDTPIKLNHTTNKASVSTQQITPCVTIRNTNKFVLYTEVINVYCETNTEHINTQR
jgi:hypothetical protein